jgi:hypothetical protein
MPPGATRRGIEAGRRLVQEDQLRVADDPDRDVRAAALPARERPDARVTNVAEPDPLGRLVNRARRR